jgi:hypothetical protein
MLLSEIKSEYEPIKGSTFIFVHLTKMFRKLQSHNQSTRGKTWIVSKISVFKWHLKVRYSRLFENSFTSSHSTFEISEPIF